MKKKPKLTKDGKKITNLTWCQLAGVYIGLIQHSPNHFKCGMWMPDGTHIVNSRANLSLQF